MWWLALAAVVFLCAGCASALTTAQQESLEEVQALADATARVYKIPPVKVIVDSAPRFGPQFNLIQVTPQILGADLPVRDVAVASLLAFMIIRPPLPMSEAHERELNRRYFPESNVQAVDILVRVKGLPPAIAVREVHAFLATQARLQQAGRDRPTYLSRTPHPCVDIKALLREFPQSGLGPTESCP
jgi:hypothetical protein